jgi:hypothetical protein
MRLLYHYWKVIYSMMNTPYWEADSRSADQEFPSFFMETNIHFRFQKTRHRSQSRTTWTYTLTPYCLEFNLHPLEIYSRYPNSLFRSGGRLQFCGRATCPAYLIVPDSITLIAGLCGEEYRLRSSSSRNYFHPPVTFSSALCPQTSSIYVLPL